MRQFITFCLFRINQTAQGLRRWIFILSDFPLTLSLNQAPVKLLFCERYHIFFFKLYFRVCFDCRSKTSTKTEGESRCCSNRQRCLHIQAFKLFPVELSNASLNTGRQLLCLNSGSASQRRAKAVPIRRLLQMQPTNTTSLFLEDAPLLSFLASHIPRLFAHPKKKKERENGDIAWRRSSLSRAWAAEIVTWGRSQEMLQRLDRHI